MNSILRALAGIVALFAASHAPAAGPAVRMEPLMGNPLEQASLQRGAKMFVNYCLGCHDAQYMRYNRLADIGLTEDQILDNLIFTGVKVGEKMMNAMSTADAKAWFGGPAPDLTLQARVRGAEWIYNYLLAFYRDDSTTTGWNNLLFPGVAMPHVLWNLAGTHTMVATEYASHDQARGAQIQASGVTELVPPADDKGKWVLRTLHSDQPGEVSPAEYRAALTDLVNYMRYMSEPAQQKRGTIGLLVLIFLGLLFPLALWLKKEFWKDVR